MRSGSSCRDPKPSRPVQIFGSGGATGSSSSCYAGETQGCYPPVSVFHQFSRLHACSSVKHAATFPLFWLLLICVSIVIQVWLVTWREQQGRTEPVEERLIPPWEYRTAAEIACQSAPPF